MHNIFIPRCKGRLSSDFVSMANEKKLLLLLCHMPIVSVDISTDKIRMWCSSIVEVSKGQEI